jgi:hypothetical protein
MEILNKKLFNKLTPAEFITVIDNLAKTILLCASVDKRIYSVFVYPDKDDPKSDCAPQINVLCRTDHMFWNIILSKQLVKNNKYVVTWAVYGRDWQNPIEDPKPIKTCLKAMVEFRNILDKLVLLAEYVLQENEFDYLDNYEEY